MSSPVFAEHYYDFAFMVSESQGTRSFDAGFITNGGSADLPLDAGLVLVQDVTGEITVTAKPSGNTGNGSFTAGPVAADFCRAGLYLVEFTGAATFNVLAPGGGSLAAGIVGTAYSDELAFTITAGGIAFAAGDSFAIEVAAGTGLWQPYAAGMEAANVGILCNRVMLPPGVTRRVTVLTRDAQVNAAEIVWDFTVSADGTVTPATGSNTGNGTIGSLSIIAAGTFAGGVQPMVPNGIYTLTAMDADTFAVLDPTGLVLPSATVGAAYAESVGFTITAGSAPFVAGDSFTLAVVQGGKTLALSALASRGIVAR